MLIVSFFFVPFQYQVKNLVLKLGQMADQMRSLQLNALILLVIKLEEKHYDYTIENSRSTCPLKDGTKGVMAADSIRFIGGENKVYLHKTLLKKAVNYKLLIV